MWQEIDMNCMSYVLYRRLSKYLLSIQRCFYFRLQICERLNRNHVQFRVMFLGSQRKQENLDEPYTDTESRVIKREHTELQHLCLFSFVFSVV